MNLPWLVIGDFNTVLRIYEKKGGRSPLGVEMQDFHDQWCYKAGVGGVSCLNVSKPKNIPFGIFKVWLEEDSFKELIQDAWNGNIHGNPAYVFMNNMKLMKIKIREWNWNVFGDVKVKMKEAEQEMMKASLLSDNDPSNISLLNDLVCARGVITEEDNMMLETVPSGQEIKEVVFSLNVDSAPGPDGFPGFFYRYAWDIIREGMIKTIQYCWNNGFIPRGMNSNFLFLIPKVKCARKPNQYRPIGLSNFSFKIFTKIITSRMYGLLEKVVSSQQGSFVKGRCIQEKIMLASEMVNVLDIKRRGVLVNGGPVGFFSVSRGLRQGDPLSPILFVVAEDVLSRTLSKLVKEKKIMPMVNRGGVQPTHILFADDVFLFFNGHKKNIHSDMNLLRDYQVSSG
ncbi:uncharacterized protein LOC113272677 [Papaver somniferum]|uniref:uncharacterized protein LOC113272677 n=1 Tax=Papaver somniferum TaxID=3469 RepID=UPI000E6F81E9|nr:uncharacterized protein LOC113272677 [Papaver somniferum]